MRNSPLRHNLARLRLFLNLGQKEMADLAGCSRRAVQSVELGKLDLSEGLARRISNETWIAAEWLLENDLKAPLTGDGFYPFTVEDYNKARTLRDLGLPSLPRGLTTYATGGEPRTIAFYAWMRAIFATRNGDIALWQTGKFLEKLAEKYGHNPDIVSTPQLKVAALRDYRLLRQQAKIGMRLAEKFTRRWRKGEPMFGGSPGGPLVVRIATTKKRARKKIGGPKKESAAEKIKQCGRSSGRFSESV